MKDQVAELMNFLRSSTWSMLDSTPRSSSIPGTTERRYARSYVKSVGALSFKLNRQKHALRYRGVLISGECGGGLELTLSGRAPRIISVSTGIF